MSRPGATGATCSVCGYSIDMPLGNDLGDLLVGMAFIPHWIYEHTSSVHKFRAFLWDRVLEKRQVYMDYPWTIGEACDLLMTSGGYSDADED